MVFVVSIGITTFFLTRILYNKNDESAIKFMKYAIS